jgi:hypothetical protein
MPFEHRKARAPSIPARKSIQGVIAVISRISSQKETMPMSGDNGPQALDIPNRPTPTFGNPDLPPEGRLNTADNPESLRSDGPRNPMIESSPRRWIRLPPISVRSPSSGRR